MDAYNFYRHFGDSPDKMKEHELCDEYITEVILLAPKVHCTKSTNENTLKENIVTKASKNNQSNQDDYKNALINNGNKYSEQLRVRSIKHEMKIIKENKLALSPFDYKGIELYVV